MIRPLILAVLLLRPPAIPPEVPCVRVVDGDTIVCEIEGKRVSVRLLGVDTPETRHPRKGVEPWGPEASAYTKSRLVGQPVRLVADTVSKPADHFGRRLAWVFLGDGECLNETLVREGYGRAYVDEFPVDPVMTVKLQLLERSAREARRGLWAQPKGPPE